MSFPENDTEYQENVIDKVERDGDSFTIRFHNPTEH